MYNYNLAGDDAEFVYMDDISRIPLGHENLAGVPRRISPQFSLPTFLHACAIRLACETSTVHAGDCHYTHCMGVWTMAFLLRGRVEL